MSFVRGTATITEFKDVHLFFVYLGWLMWPRLRADTLFSLSITRDGLVFLFYWWKLHNIYSSKWHILYTWIEITACKVTSNTKQHFIVVEPWFWSRFGHNNADQKSTCSSMLHIFAKATTHSKWRGNSKKKLIFLPSVFSFLFFSYSSHWTLKSRSGESTFFCSS